GTNTYTGTTTINSGTLQAGSNTAFGTGAITVNTGATLDLATYCGILNKISGAGMVVQTCPDGLYLDGTILSTPGKHLCR
ncbi:hypothetical protein HC928_21645, partial [bacterium]|nr:hypothetical protein [bacterium]